MDHLPGLVETMPTGDTGSSADTVVSAGKALVHRLIPLPDSQSVGPLTILPTLVQGSEADAGVGDLAVPLDRNPAVSIVAQAASVLNEEIAKGVLAARDVPGGSASNGLNAGHPVMRQMNELAEQLSKLWSQHQSSRIADLPPQTKPINHSESLVTLRSRQATRPGERVSISLALRNGERQSIRLAPVATDLICSRGHRISCAVLTFNPSQMTLAPDEQRSLEIAAVVPSDTPPGCYYGLLVVNGLDYLRALIAIEVANSGAPASDDRSIDASASSLPSSTEGAYGYQSRNSASTGTHVDGALMAEAIKLAMDGELGNSDAIRLLQLPHQAEEIKAVLSRFDTLLTREARSKLTLEALVPLPDNVDNQRFEPLFERYPISGKTYTTASGITLPTEIQYYNGEMVQVHGACSNLAQVREALAGSGYQPMVIRSPEGRESAIAQFWSHQFTDTSMRPYNAAFVIVVAVPHGDPAGSAHISADGSGTSTVLPMFDGTYHSERGLYENRACLFFIRLLDSTQVAIEVGRERMGTDKRAGTILVTRAGSKRLFSVSDGAGSPVTSIEFNTQPSGDDIGHSLQRAAGAAGLSLHAFPPGTEYVFPVAARIGNRPIVKWQWRTDVLARLQRTSPNAIRFDARSEEGALLTQWGFEPQVLGYIPNVRGVVTGLP